MSVNNIIAEPQPDNPLRITFLGDYSFGEGETLLNQVWDFGDGNSSNSANPIHTYNTSGIFLITLMVVTSLQIITFTTWRTFQATPILNVPIRTLIKSKLPGRMYIDFQESINNSIRKWQEYLQPQVEPTLELTSTYIESAWPILWNNLIAELVRYDLFFDEGVISALKMTSSITDNNLATIESTGGSVKRIESGPAQVEFHEDRKQDPDSVSRLYNSLYSGGDKSMLYAYQQQCCVLAARVNAILPFCKQHNHNFLNKVSKPT